METTHEQQMAVRRDECRLHGHSFRESLMMGSLAPKRVMCSHCGAAWRIHPDDIDANFGMPSVAPTVDAGIDR